MSIFNFLELLKIKKYFKTISNKKAFLTACQQTLQ
jgi:hypothetical protein